MEIETDLISSHEQESHERRAKHLINYINSARFYHDYYMSTPAHYFTMIITCQLQPTMAILPFALKPEKMITSTILDMGYFFLDLQCTT